MAENDETTPTADTKYVKVDELRSGNEGSGCLRPLGLCELGGCCDICWYGQKKQDENPPDQKQTAG